MPPEADAVPHTREPSTHLRPRGSSQGGLRQYNERVVLQAIRLHGAREFSQEGMHAGFFVTQPDVQTMNVAAGSQRHI